MSIIKHKKKDLVWIKLLIIIIILLGIFFRFANLDKKVYWNDEVFTSLRVSGYTEKELKEQLYNGSIIGIENLQNYQKPNAEKNGFNTIIGLAKEEAQLPPLYFLLTRFWVLLFEPSILVTRSLAALFSVLSIFGIYLLCQELFQSSLVSWMAMALIAISPFQIVYANEARQYSLWTLIILLSSWLLLRAVRLNNHLSWRLYLISAVLNLYTSFSSLFVIAAHGVYVSLREKLKLTEILIKCLFSLGIALVIFSPWLLFFLIGAHEAQGRIGWSSKSFNNGIIALVFAWLRNLTRLFADFSNLNLNYESTLQNPSIFLFLALPIFLLIVYSFYYLCRHTTREIWLFVITLLVFTVLPFVLPDLLLGGRRSSAMRYLIPAYLAIYLSVAYFLTAKAFYPFAKSWKSRFWQIVIILLFSLSILSDLQISSAQIWWNKDPSRYSQDTEIAKFVNQTANPLIISDTRWTNIITLSHRLKPNVKFLLLDSKSRSTLPNGFSDYFLYQASDSLVITIRKEPTIVIKPLLQLQNTKLWKLEKSDFQDTTMRGIKGKNYKSITTPTVIK